ncbi:hypothetical protein V501_00789 [Pseudogymnoascus sp. VKM F-4519 (FW-2642)]|nr:hypothetical protein V501_00789 [Pseudogymnoascus sp. VKM F-4519 (FW-2642)]
MLSFALDIFDVAKSRPCYVFADVCVSPFSGVIIIMRPTAYGDKTRAVSTATKVAQGQVNDETMQSKSSSIWKRIAGKLGINIPIVLLMIKYQDNQVADHFLTIGYLIPIMSILAVPIFPQARFIQNLLVASLLVCLAAAISLLAMWCAVKARENTTHISKEALANGPVTGAQVSPSYNAAASANMGIWLFFEVWLINTFRAYRPQYFLPSIIFSIFINVTGTYGTLFVTMKQVEALVSRLLQTFFAGFGISASVSLVIVPFSSRTIISMLVTEELHGLKSILEVQGQYMLSLPMREWYGTKSSTTYARSANKSWFSTRAKPWPEADALKKVTADVTELQVKVQSELRYAKREVAWGKLGSKDMVTICRLIKNILVPILGIESFIGITDRIEKRGGWEALRVPKTANSLTESKSNSLEDKEKGQWKEILEQLNDRVRQLQKTVIEGFDHSLYTLELAKRPLSPADTDIEANSLGYSAGERGFAKYLENAIQDFLRQREGPLKKWCAEMGVDDSSQLNGMKPSDNSLHELHQSQLYLILDLEYSFLVTAREVLNLVKYADSKVDDGTMSKKRLILPTCKQMKKWFWAMLSREDSNLDYQVYSTRSGSPTVHLGDAIQGEKDTEHLRPTSVWEKVTDKFRVIPNFFGSAESAFGFRVATGTMAIAIICFLRNSQQFFIEQRLIWGSIMVAISMTQTAGSGVYGQFLRFSGTLVAMVASYIIWYIVDQHPAGIIVFTGITMFLYHYPLIKSPNNPVIPMIGMVTVILIVGYELQVQKIGILRSISNGQAYHPLYELAPFRLATVVAGVSVAFFFTYFPSVITARSQLRKDLGSCLYILCNYYSSVHQTVALQSRDAEGDLKDKGSPGRRLEKARIRLYVKDLVLLQGIEKHVKFTAWEPTFGGKFPQASYDSIIRFTTMTAHASETFRVLPIADNTQNTPGSWLKDFKRLISSLQLTSQEVTSLLAIVASAISTGRPMPPYLKAPQFMNLRQLLNRMDGDILSTRHVLEPGYTAFAVIQVSSTMLRDDLEGLLEETKNLVGEAKFNIDVTGIENLNADPVMMGGRGD